MNLIFATLHEEFVELAKERGHTVHHMNICDYVPTKTTIYVSPANSLGFMDGGVDIPLSTCIFPGIDVVLRDRIQQIGRTSSIRRKYFPVSSAIFIPNSSDISPHVHGMISAPTMLRPQDIRGTLNVMRATQAVRKLCEKLCLNDVDVVFTSMGCGYGKLEARESLDQIETGWRTYMEYPETDDPDELIIPSTMFIHKSYVSARHQPDTYENSEFFLPPPATSTYTSFLHAKF
jgi:O-acetyl-ADP-ribose deacetylase (regulator of RNase III)